jgi:alkanesulfonate monooxygenase SsuD/methylene tetrahydromethanopterin reductase-like flavin-dependent oxidoreductase (luciferase family)
VEMTKMKLRVFPAIPRNPDPAKCIDELMRVARFSDRNGFAGILLFAGNDTLVEPWSIAQHILAHTSESSPLIAVNPIYMHPFTVAKFVSSFALLYHRKVYLNNDHRHGDKRSARAGRAALPSRQIFKAGRIHTHCASTVGQHQTRHF